MVKAMKSRSRPSRRPRGRRAVVKRALAKSWKRSVAKVCKRVISRQAEVKVALSQKSLSPCTIYGNAIAGNTNPATGGSYANFYGYNVIPVTPASTFIDILQGNAQNQRTGNTIKTKSSRMRIVLTCRPYDAGNNPSQSNRPTNVTFMCVSPKLSSAGGSTMCDIFATKIFQNVTSGVSPVSTSSGYTSSLTDNVLPVNTDVVNVHFKRTYKLGHSSYDNGVTTDPYYEYFGNNDYKMNKIISFDFTRFMPKTIKYDDNSASPQSKTVYLLVFLTKPDGTVYTSIPSPQFGPQPIDMWYMHEYKYTDM